MREKLWFEKYQGILLALANTDYGRDLLCIDKGFPIITKIAPHYIQTYRGDNQYTTEFRMTPKYANVIRYRWNAIVPALQWFTDIEMGHSFQFSPVLARGLRGAQTVVYPNASGDADPTTVDGRVGNDGLATTWTGVRDTASGNVAQDGLTSGEHVFLETDASSNWRGLFRSFYLFDASSIDDTDTVDSATLSVFGTAKTDNFTLTANQSNFHIVSSNPASNTALVTGDFDQIGTTDFGSVTYSAWSTSAYNDVTLNASGIANISLTGISKFAARSGADLDNDEPTVGASKLASLSGYWAEQTGTSNDPKLTVNHTAVGNTRSPSGGAAYGSPMMY